MDKIWYRNPSKSEVIGRCDGNEKKRMTTQNRQKSNAKRQMKRKRSEYSLAARVCDSVIVLFYFVSHWNNLILSCDYHKCYMNYSV